MLSVVPSEFSTHWWIVNIINKIIQIVFIKTSCYITLNVCCLGIARLLIKHSITSACICGEDNWMCQRMMDDQAYMLLP